MKKVSSLITIAVFCFFFFSLFIQPVIAQNEIGVDFFYTSGCGSCIEKKEVVDDIEDHYNESELIFKMKNINLNESYEQEWSEEYAEYGYPLVVIYNKTNKTIMPFEEITYSNLNSTINAYLSGKEIKNKTDNIREIPLLFWNIEVNFSNLSLPVLTIILGGLDSFNPCAFFILIFLMNLLIYAKSRRRMLLIGGIFIFFSGLLYAFFMFVLYETFKYIAYVTVFAGALTLTLGVLSIKDFFFFKKGVSLSIPEDKKPKLFKQMRNLVKNPKLSSVIIGSIILAATVNFYELLCTLGLPAAFTTQLEKYGLSPIESATYIFFYNVVYVIPLIIIVLIFVLTLGKRKLSEWHGRAMKLVSGTMLTCFGIIFLIDYKILENPMTPILLLIFTLVFSGVVSFIWKKFFLTEK